MTVEKLNSSTDKWNQIAWSEVEDFVWKFQRKIYDASSLGDLCEVHRLQILWTNV
jgi:hypothetical protein